ncbi:MAG: peptidoglycan DD-metalloendopeptidase family protein [Pseudomonadota bacterium]
MQNTFLKRLILTSACLTVALTISLHEYCRHPSGQPDLREEGIQEVDLEAEPDATSPDIPEPITQTVQLTVGRGDTFAKLLKREGFSGSQIHHMMTGVKKHYNPRSLHPKHVIELTRHTKDGHFLTLAIRPRLDQEIMITPDDNGGYKTENRVIELTRTLHLAEGAIDGSLYQALISQGVPASMVHHMIMAYSYDVDFQRSLHLGDSYGLFYTTYQDPHTGQKRPGEILFAYLVVGGKTMPIYRFKSNSGAYRFYNPKGESVRKGLLRTPVDGARISGSFGFRKRHPVLGYGKMHKGIDFAAPRGTPIVAAGSGIVERASRWGSYGNYIRIRHNGEYSTAYAHLSRYAKGIRRGQRVRQGQIIGYIGATGRATGPHLHYEVLRYKKQINPVKLKLIPTTKLQGIELERFQLAKLDLDRQCNSLKETMQDAQVQLAMKSDVGAEKKVVVR